MSYKGIWIETTNRCNLRCKTCGRDYIGEDMPLELFTKIADEFFPQIEEVNMTGLGEPAITKDFDKMCSIVLKKYRKNLSFVSNGMLLNRNEYLLDLLIDDNVNLALSIDGMGDTYNEIRRGASWSSMLELLEKIRMRREQKKTSFSLGMNFVLCKENKSMLLDMVEKAALEWKFDYVCLIMMNLWSGNEEYYKQSSPVVFKKDANHLIDEVSQLAEKLNIRVMLPNKFNLTEENSQHNGLDKSKKSLGLTNMYKYLRNTPVRAVLQSPRFLYYRHHNIYRMFYKALSLPRLRCNVPFEMLYFKVTGEVTPCCGLQNHILGSTKNNSINEILNDKPYQALLENMAQKYLPAECFRCNLPMGINKGNPDK